jgi:predicted nucleic-acid-binding Zn-ribbon protein
VSGIKYAILSILILYMSACTPETCLDETESYLKVTFYNYSTRTISAPSTISVHGVGRDSLLYNQATQVKSAKLPLNQMADTTAFVLTINSISDTLIIRHTSFPHLISRECGYTYYFNIEPPVTTRHIIDSISAPNRTITTQNEENLRIFY